MPPNKDYYKILGVSETATQDEIKKAYRGLAKKYHPDVTGGDKAKEARFKEVTEANETLSDEKKRAEYDAIRKSPFGPGGGGFEGGFPGGFPGGFGGSGGRVRVDVRDFSDMFGGGAQPRPGAGPGAGPGGFGDFFSDLFGGGAEAGRGRDVRARLDVDFATAALGGELTVTVEGKKHHVRVPGGAQDGDVITLQGKGRPGGGRGGAGDLLLEIRTRPDARFRRQGDDLEVDVPVPVETAIVGGKVAVTTLEGTAQVTVPGGTSSGVKLRLRGKGARKRGAGDARGDLFAVVQITVPKDIPPRARELIEEFAKITRK